MRHLPAIAAEALSLSVHGIAFTADGPRRPRARLESQRVAAQETSPSSLDLEMATRLHQLVTGYRASQVVSTVARFRIADRLASGPVTSIISPSVSTSLTTICTASSWRR